MKKEEVNKLNNPKEKAQPMNLKKNQSGQRFRIQFDFEYKGDPGQIKDPKRISVPDMSLTVRQMLEKHSRGEAPGVKIQQPLFLEIPVPVIHDFTDVDRYREQLEEQIKKVDEFKKQKEKEEEEEKNRPEKQKEELRKKAEEAVKLREEIERVQGQRPKRQEEDL